MKTKFTISEIYQRRYFCNTFCNLRLIFSGLTEDISNLCYLKKIHSSLICILFMLSFSVINNAQQVNEVNYAIQQLANSSDPVLQQQAVELNRFVDDANPNLMANPTLCIDENGITTIDGDVPEVVKVKMGLMDQLYSQHPDFENIRIIRIVIEDISDLNKLINLKNLIYFPNLKYIYFLSLFEVCPNNPENVVCQTSTFSKMVSGSEETSDIKVLFKVSSVW